MPAYQTPLPARPGEVTISPFSYQSLGIAMAGMGQVLASGATVAAAMVMYVPFWTPEPLRITKLWWAVGAGTAGNVDAGVYDLAGTLLLSAGTTAMSATVSAVQSVDTTDTTIARGTYYMALVGSTVTTQTFLRVAPAAGIVQSLGVLQQDISGTGLPLATNASPATFAKCTTAWIPLFGVQGYRAVGP